MNFIVSSKSLALALKNTKALFQKDPVIPIVENYLFQCTPEVLTITYTTLRQTYSVNVYHNSTTTFSFCIDARRLYSFISKLEEQPIEFQKNETSVRINFFHGTLVMDTDEANDFPKTPHIFKENFRTEIKSGFFIPSLKRMLPAVSTDDLRPAMTGVQLIFTENLLTIASTNGHYLFSTEIIGDWTPANPEQIIIPRVSVQHIVSIFNQSEPIAFRFNQGYLELAQGSKKFQSRLIEERYPDWQKLFKIQPTRILKINKKKLIKQLTKIYPFLNSVTREVRIKLTPEQMTFDVKNYDYRIEYQEKIDIEDYTGQPLEIGFNQRLLLTCIENTAAENIIIEFTEPNRSAFIRPAENIEKINDVKMLMPVMVSTYE